MGIKENDEKSKEIDAVSSFFWGMVIISLMFIGYQVYLKKTNDIVDVNTTYDINVTVNVEATEISFDYEEDDSLIVFEGNFFFLTKKENNNTVVVYKSTEHKLNYQEIVYNPEFKFKDKTFDSIIVTEELVGLLYRDGNGTLTAQWTVKVGISDEDIEKHIEGLLRKTNYSYIK